MRRVLIVCVAIVLLIPAALAARGPGTLDKSFSGNGQLVEDHPNLSVARDVYVMRDGRILMAGEAPNGVLLARYSPRGRPDKSFSGNGKLVTNALDDFDRLFVVSMPNGTILVAGSEMNANGDFAILKLSKNGKVKESYGSNGVLAIDFGGEENVRNATLAPNRKLYVIGNTDDSIGTTIARLNPNGTLDSNTDSDPGSSWSEDGKVTTEGNGGVGIKPLKQGKVIAAAITSSYDLVLARFMPDGTPDTSYHGDGTIELDLGPNITHVESAGFGPGGVVVGANVNSPTADDFRVIRVTLGGELVNGFGGGGSKTYDLGADEDVTMPLLDAKGRPIIVGETIQNEVDRWFVLRLKKSGERDGSFGKNGVARIRFFPNSAQEFSSTRASEIQPDGRIVVAGQTSKNSEKPHAALARVRAR